MNHIREGGNSGPSNALCLLSTLKSIVQVRCRVCQEIMSCSASLREHCESMAHVARVATQLTTTPPTTSATMLSPSSVTSAALTTTSTPTTVASPSKSKQSVTPTCGDFTSTHSMSTTTTVSMASGEAQPEALSKSIKSQLVLECRNCSFETTDKAQAIEHMNQHQVELSDDKEIMLMDTEDNGSSWEGGREEGGEGDEGEEREEELEEQKEGEGLCLCKFALDCRL